MVRRELPRGTDVANRQPEIATCIVKTYSIIA